MLSSKETLWEKFRMWKKLKRSCLIEGPESHLLPPPYTHPCEEQPEYLGMEGRKPWFKSSRSFYRWNNWGAVSLLTPWTSAGSQRQTRRVGRWHHAEHWLNLNRNLPWKHLGSPYWALDALPPRLTGEKKTIVAKSWHLDHLQGHRWLCALSFSSHGSRTKCEQPMGMSATSIVTIAESAFHSCQKGGHLGQADYISCRIGSLLHWKACQTHREGVAGSEHPEELRNTSLC